LFGPDFLYFFFSYFRVKIFSTVTPRQAACCGGHDENTTRARQEARDKQARIRTRSLDLLQLLGGCVVPHRLAKP